MRKRQVVVRRSTSASEEAARRAAAAEAAVGRGALIRYGECQKNHAVGVGGYAVDGCREFMASGEEGTTAALACAACGCHRNFHRRESDAANNHHREVDYECSSSPSSNGV